MKEVQSIKMQLYQVFMDLHATDKFIYLVSSLNSRMPHSFERSGKNPCYGVINNSEYPIYICEKISAISSETEMPRAPFITRTLWLKFYEFGAPIIYVISVV